MKKFLATILSVGIIFSMSVCAYAEDTLTLKATVPEEPTYTLTIPKGTQTLRYGDTGIQLLGEMKVENVSKVDLIAVKPRYEDLKNTSNSSDTIGLELYCKDDLENMEKIKNTGVLDSNGMICLAFPGTRSGEYAYQNFKLYAMVPDWSGATLGATYSATVTYEVKTSN